MRKTLTMLVTLIGLAAARPVAADTFRIEIDYMVDTDHTHEPSPLVINAVVQMFACQGHTLIIDVDDALPHYDVLERDPTNCGDPEVCPTLFGYSGVANSYGNIKANFKDHDSTWHYCIFAHQYDNCDCNASTSSGLAEILGDDFIVTLGSGVGQTGTEYDQAASLAHEFGHNLGLGHCGNQNCGGNTGAADYVGPYVANMPSVMTYQYQLSGVRARMLWLGLIPEEAIYRELDYSHGRLCTVDEDNLNEQLGTVMTFTDWDCDGSIEASVAKNINNPSGSFCDTAGNRTLVTDYDEWANISDPLVLFRSDELEDMPESHCSEMPVLDDADEFFYRGGFEETPLSVEPCTLGENVFLRSIGGAGIGTCWSPYISVQTAQTQSPSYSRYFLYPGTYNETNGLLLDKPGMYLCHALGTALIE